MPPLPIPLPPPWNNHHSPPASSKGCRRLREKETGCFWPMKENYPLPAYQHRQTVNMMFWPMKENYPSTQNKKSRKTARSAELIPSESTSFAFATALQEIKSSREEKNNVLCPMAAYKPAILPYVCVVPIAACRCLSPIMFYLLYSRLYPWPSASSSQHHLRRPLFFFIILAMPCTPQPPLLLLWPGRRQTAALRPGTPPHPIFASRTTTFSSSTPPEAVDSQGVTAHIRQTVLPSATKQPANQHQQTDAQQRARQSANELHRQLQWVMEQHIIRQHRRTTPRHEQEADRRRSCHPPHVCFQPSVIIPSSHSLAKRI